MPSKVLEQIQQLGQDLLNLVRIVMLVAEGLPTGEYVPLVVAEEVQIVMRTSLRSR